MTDEVDKPDGYYRTRDVCDQLTRYGGGVYFSEMNEILELLVDINDDLNHYRSLKVALENIMRIEASLNNLKNTLIEHYKPSSLE